MSCLQYCEVWITGNKWVYNRSNREIILFAHPKHMDGIATFYMGTVSQTDSELLEEPDDLVVYIHNNFLKDKTAILDTTETATQEIAKKALVKDIEAGQAGGAIILEVNDIP